MLLIEAWFVNAVSDGFFAFGRESGPAPFGGNIRKGGRLLHSVGNCFEKLLEPFVNGSVGRKFIDVKAAGG